MQFRVVRLKMIAEPAIQVVGQFLFIKCAVVLHSVHDVAQVVEQGFVIFFVFGI